MTHQSSIVSALYRSLVLSIALFIVHNATFLFRVKHNLPLSKLCFIEFSSALIILGFITRVLRGHSILPKSQILFPVVILCALIQLSMNAHASDYAFQTFGKNFQILLLLASIASFEKVIVHSIGLACLSLVTVNFGMYLSSFFDSLPMNNRFSGIFPHPNKASTCALLSLIYLSQITKFSLLLKTIGAILAFTVIIVSGSRTGILLLTLLLVILIYKNSDSKISRSFRLVLTCLSSVAVVIFVTFKRELTIWNLPTFGGRLEIWSSYLYSSLNNFNELFWGHGISTNPPLLASFTYYGSFQGRFPYHAHSSYIQLVWIFGLIALPIIIWIYREIFRSITIKNSLLQHDTHKAASLMFLFLFLMSLIYVSPVFPTHVDEPNGDAIIFWLLIGSLLKLRSEKKRDNYKSSTIIPSSYVCIGFLFALLYPFIYSESLLKAQEKSESNVDLGKVEGFSTHTTYLHNPYPQIIASSSDAAIKEIQLLFGWTLQNPESLSINHTGSTILQKYRINSFQPTWNFKSGSLSFARRGIHAYRSPNRLVLFSNKGVSHLGNTLVIKHSGSLTPLRYQHASIQSNSKNETFLSSEDREWLAVFKIKDSDSISITEDPIIPEEPSFSWSSIPSNTIGVFSSDLNSDGIRDTAIVQENHRNLTLHTFIRSGTSSYYKSVTSDMYLPDQDCIPHSSRPILTTSSKFIGLTVRCHTHAHFAAKTLIYFTHEESNTLLSIPEYQLPNSLESTCFENPIHSSIECILFHTNGIDHYRLEENFRLISSKSGYSFRARQNELFSFSLLQSENTLQISNSQPHILPKVNINESGSISLERPLISHTLSENIFFQEGIIPNDFDRVINKIGPLLHKKSKHILFADVDYDSDSDVIVFHKTQKPNGYSNSAVTLLMNDSSKDSF